MKKLLICSMIALTGCATSVPVTMSFPQAPEDLKVACSDIKLLNPATTKLSEVVGVVGENYGQYQECQIKINGWIQWYESQKKIYESVK